MRYTKYFLTVIMTLLLISASPGLAGKHSRNLSMFDGELYSSDDLIIDIEKGSVIITNEYEDDEIEITDEYELIINGDRIETTPDQQKLLEEYHTLVFDIKDYALEIGKEGAKIGIEGARIGLKAVGGVIKMIFTDYDEDDLDRDLERETEAIEAKAEVLEDKADKIEEMADDLDDLFYDMEESIPAIAKLDW